MELTFEYAIRFFNGLYYTGRANSVREPNAWQGPKSEAFTFTERGAYTKIAKCPSLAGCTVEHVL